MMHRRFRDEGLHPAVGYTILTCAFTGLSLYLFYRISYAPVLYVLLALSVLFGLTETRRNEFLKICYSGSGKNKIRILENLMVSFPFLLFLVYKGLLLFICILLFFSWLLAMLNFSVSLHFTIPTPFRKRPFEFTSGFRNTFWFLAAAYLLAIIAVWVNNFNLGIFAQLTVFATTLSYYSRPEHEYYVWSHAGNAGKFLLGKIGTGLLFSSVLVLPLVLMLSLVFTKDIVAIVMFLLAGYAFLVCMILAKYAAYPKQLNLPQTVIMGLCIYFPPLLGVVIPYFAVQSVRRLKYYLQ